MLTDAGLRNGTGWEWQQRRPKGEIAKGRESD